MTKTYKTEVILNDEQKEIFFKTRGVCRFVFNKFIEVNKQRHADGQPYLNSMGFRKWMNNTWIPGDPSVSFIKDVSSKAVTQAIDDADGAYKRFMKGKGGFPRFKQRGVREPSVYFVNNNPSANHPSIEVTTRDIKIPCMDCRKKNRKHGNRNTNIKLKEHGYLPHADEDHRILSGRLSSKAGRFYVTLVVEEKAPKKPGLTSEVIGLDRGIKEFVVTSTGMFYQNINQSRKLRKLYKQIEHLQRAMARKREQAKKENRKVGKNYEKDRLKLQKLWQRVDNARTDYINKCIAEITGSLPKRIVIEDLNIKGMMKNRYLARAIGQMRWYEFETRLAAKCKILGIELVEVSRRYPSSKTCSHCGYIHKDLKLKDRVYVCPQCGFRMDRDLNAAINLANNTNYTVVV